MSDVKAEAYSGGGGCLSTIVLGVFVWALLFGVTWNGVHHEIDCSCEGVEVKSKEINQ